MRDTIYRQDAIDAFRDVNLNIMQGDAAIGRRDYIKPKEAVKIIENLPSAQSTLYGYNIEHLELIARVLQKENLPPERVVEALTDIGRIVAIVADEFEESLRKAVEQCMI